MAHYLVTGGAGFIGSHLVEHLVKKGEKVRVLDNLETGKEENLRPFKGQIEFIKGDIRDISVCKKACQGINYVLHEAALGSVPRSVADPLTSNDVNITGTLNMLWASKEAGVKRFVFASSSAIYGDSPTLPKVETMPPNPLSPYGLSKHAGEVYTLLFCRLYGLQTVALRYFNVFGPRQAPESQYAAVIPHFISRLVRGESPIIYGDGEQGRDFTYVSDVVQANLLACTADSKACGKTYNIACNQIHTLNKLFELVRQYVGKEIPASVKIKPIYESARVGDIKFSQAGVEEAKKNLGFVAGVSFEEGIKKTVNFFGKGSGNAGK